jgi:hypothetical protein
MQTRDAAGPSRGRRPRLGLPCRVPDEQRMDEKGTEGDRKGWQNWVVSCRVESCRVERGAESRALSSLFFSLALSQLLHEVTEAASKAQAVELRAAYSRPNADL